MEGDACWWLDCSQPGGKDGLCIAHHTKDLRLKRTYGVGLADVDRILTRQGWRCPVGGESLLGNEDWVMDHSHRNRRVRGILCRYHNHRVVGRHEDGDLLIRAGEYLNDPPAFAVLGEMATVPKKKRRRKPPVPKN